MRLEQEANIINALNNMRRWAWVVKKNTKGHNTAVFCMADQVLHRLERIDDMLDGCGTDRVADDLFTAPLRGKP